MKRDFKDESFDYLFDAVLTLKTREECYDFFEDLCTIQELKAMAQRINVAKMLRSNIVYSKIAATTGASTATISRVNRSLNDYDGTGGYDMVFERLNKD